MAPSSQVKEPPGKPERFRIRAMLYMAAVSAIRGNPHVKRAYERLVERGKAKKVALGAAMRKLVHLCFGVLKTRQSYQPDYATPA
jgi:transposase